MSADGDNGTRQESWFLLIFKHGSGWVAAIVAALALFGIGYGTRYVTAPPSPGPTSRATASAPQSPTPSVTPGTVLETASGVDLAEGYAISLTGTSLRPYQSDTSSGDLYDDASGWVGSSAQLAILDGAPSYAGCRVDTQFVTSGEGIGPDTNLAQKNLCVTVGHRIAGVAVDADNRAGSGDSLYVTINITVWQDS